MAKTSRNDEGIIDDELQPVDPPPPGQPLPDQGRIPGASYDPNNPSGVINLANPNADPSKSFVQGGTTGGYVNGHVTLGAGTSQTQEDVDNAIADARAQGIPEEFITQFINQNGARDAHRLGEAYFSDGGGAGGAGGSGGGWGGGYNGPFAPPSTAGGWMPSYTAPTFNAPAPFVAPTWDAPAPFTAPTIEEARNEPGFAFAMEQGTKALQNSAASKGLLRTGGTMKELIGFGQKLGDQNYGNVYNRASQTYDTNYGLSRDKFDRTYTGASDEYGSRYKTAWDDWTARTHGAEAEFAPKKDEAVMDYDARMAIWKEKLRIAGLLEADSD